MPFLTNVPLYFIDTIFLDKVKLRIDILKFQSKLCVNKT